MWGRRRNDGLVAGLVLGLSMAMTNTVLSANAEGSQVVSLTPANYHALTAGKVVFLKFYAPWVSGRVSEMMSPLLGLWILGLWKGGADVS